MKNNRCYVISAAQVSCQKPLSEEWLTAPIVYSQSYARAIEPDTKAFIAPSEARRMSWILKRTVCASLSALSQSGISNPDAIITGTGMGCMENSEKFLIDLCKFGENCLKPTLFMQSTHNTISSLIGIILKCHGYNNTYSHKGLSFESALLDGWLQIKAWAIGNALVGSHDEVTPMMASVFNHIHPDYAFISETSVSAMLSGEMHQGDCLCEVEDVAILYKPSADELLGAIHAEPHTAVMLGVNGNPLNDGAYDELIGHLPSSIATMHYKHIFGENFSSPAIAFYAGAMILHNRIVPEEMWMNKVDDMIAPDIVYIVNHSDTSVWSVIKLRRR